VGVLHSQERLICFSSTHTSTNTSSDASTHASTNAYTNASINASTNSLSQYDKLNNFHHHDCNHYDNKGQYIYDLFWHLDSGPHIR
jgi:hypothetical protein